MKHKIIWILFIVLSSFMIYLSVAASKNEKPVKPDNKTFFSVSIPEKQRIDPKILIDMENKIRTDQRNFHNILIIRNNYIVKDISFDGLTSDSLYQMYSITKSINATVLGIAIKKGYISSVKQKVVGFFTKENIANLDKKKSSMRIFHLLTMASGLEWDHWIAQTGISSQDAMMSSYNWAEYAINRPMFSVPGKEFYYSPGTAHIISAIIQQASHQTTAHLAKKYLFDPLGIDFTEERWPADPAGYSFGAAGLYLTPKDLAKIGLLYMNHGNWKGKQILPSSYVKEATRAQIIDPALNWGYGYQWWILPDKKYPSYAAMGYLGQFLFVIPKAKMIVVFTADLDPGEYIPYCSDIFYKYVLKSIK